jgi:hypothetical protein
MVELLKERLVPEEQLEDATPSDVTSVDDQAADYPDVAGSQDEQLPDHKKECIAVSIHSGVPYTERKSTFQVSCFLPCLLAQVVETSQSIPFSSNVWAT